MMRKNKKAPATGNSNGSISKTSQSRQGNNATATLYDAIEAFKQVLADNGLGYLNDIKVDAGIQRFKLPDEKGNNRSGWYTFHSGDICAGGFGNWKNGLNETWHFKQDNKPLTPAERQALSKVYADAKKKREAETQKKYAEARRISNAVWNKAQPAKPDHPYLVKKHCEDASKYLKESKGNLIVPLYNQKRLVSLQYIRGDNFGKFFVKGSELKGSYFMFGSLKKPFDKVLICEGISTGWSVSTLADHAPTFCAMSAGNLLAVSLSVRKALPDIKIIIAGDNDYKSDGSINIGVEKAKEAAQAIDGFYSIPQFPDPTQEGDWNDLYLSCCAQQKAGANHE